jgi:hypothetical protein
MQKQHKQISILAKHYKMYFKEPICGEIHCVFYLRVECNIGLFGRLT